MFILELNDLNFDEQQLPDFVSSVTNHHYGKKIILQESIASGDYKLLRFSNGFYAYVSNYIMHDDFEMELSVADDAYLALHINQIQAGSVFTLTLNKKIVCYDDKIVTSLFLTRSKDSFLVSGTSGACVNRLKILIPRLWLSQHMPAYDENLLNRYFDLEEERLSVDAMDNTYRSMVDKVMNTEDNPFYLPITQNILAVITERFFMRLNIKMQKSQRP